MAIEGKHFKGNIVMGDNIIEQTYLNIWDIIYQYAK
jgi:hypothetical protein